MSTRTFVSSQQLSIDDFRFMFETDPGSRVEVIRKMNELGIQYSPQEFINICLSDEFHETGGVCMLFNPKSYKFYEHSVWRPIRHILKRFPVVGGKFASDFGLFAFLVKSMEMESYLLDAILAIRDEVNEFANLVNASEYVVTFDDISDFKTKNAKIQAFLDLAISEHEIPHEIITKYQELIKANDIIINGILSQLEFSKDD
ncbi:MAG: hypothetical protein CMK92_05710 [Pseudomonas sp.]|nr:hypothetical protein [Pseudomonas sp.]